MSQPKKRNESMFATDDDCPPEINQKIIQNKKIFWSLLISTILMTTLFAVIGYYGSETTVIIDNDDPNGDYEGRIILPTEFPEGDYPIRIEDDGNITYISRSNLSYVAVTLIGFVVINDALLDFINANDTYKFQISYIIMLNTMITPYYNPINQQYRHEMFQSFALFHELSNRSDELFSAYGNVANVYEGDDVPNAYPSSVKVKLTSGLNLIPLCQLNFKFTNNDTEELPCIWNDFQLDSNVAKMNHGLWRITFESFNFNAEKMLNFITAVHYINQGNFTMMGKLTESGMTFNATPERGFWNSFDEMLTPATEYEKINIH